MNKNNKEYNVSLDKHKRATNFQKQSKAMGTRGTNIIDRNNNNKSEAFDENEQAIQALIASAESRQEQGNIRTLNHPKEDVTTRPTKKFKKDGVYQGRSDNHHYGKPSRHEHDHREHYAAPHQQKEERLVAAGDKTDSIPNEPEKPNFGLSGALATDDKTGNTYRGILLKFTEPPEARTPNTRWRLYVFKKKTGSKDSASNNMMMSSSTGQSASDELIEVLHISKQSAYLFGREEKVADIPVYHPSLSKQHCVLQYRALPDKKSTTGSQNQQRAVVRCKPYLMDLGSTNGTFINDVRIDEARYYELKKGDVITLGSSSREYVLLTENTTAQDL
jgi:smad nuclear-interacting protein 1